MVGSKAEKNMPIANQHWNNFISLLKEDVKDLYQEQRGIIIDIRKSVI